ncbi:unnamed protein product [Spirodela intermedia]|uniref:Uncharacterized protein n=2 Tax=Spirodela intermedia TaxID=51605 RepID=A0A7I8JH99_SPIIN|nr:unnamed protein product [Spirodela intermedia]CAA6669530.1 unnamed protein product [Spirodela intermedia]CAA7406498.1 unnamed protein product [Spirodela intermedia]
MEPDDELFFLLCDVPSLNAGPQIVQPPQPASAKEFPSTAPCF